MGSMQGTFVDENGKLREAPVLVDRYGRLLTAQPDMAGARGQGSAIGADHLSVAGGWKCQAVVYNGGAIDLWPGPALLAAYRVATVLSAHAWTISGSSCPDISIPASAAVGASESFPPGGGPAGQIFDTKITVTPNASASSGVVWFWFQPLPTTVTWAS